MHKFGYYIQDGRKIDEKIAYNGQSTLSYIKIIKKIIVANQCQSLLDYGCGKARFYNESFKSNNANYSNLRDYWNIKINLYDPGFEKYSILTKSNVDISICIDVLEHIPEEDVDWVLREFFSLTKKITFLNIACYPAKALLPNGENAHINIKTHAWWQKKLIKLSEEFKELKILALCDDRGKDNDVKWIAIEIRDQIKKYLD
jgi:hypothetical protein